jgi:hypothetical protein
MGNKLTLQIFPVGSEAKEPQIISNHKPNRRVKIIKMLVRFGFDLRKTNGNKCKIEQFKLSAGLSYSVVG